MTEEQVKDKVTQILKDVLDNDSVEITRETTAKDYAEWDSLAHINLIVAVEGQFGIKFSLEELKSFDTIGDILDLIRRKTSGVA